MEELIQRCSWATTDLYKEYHDNEWGKPVHDENKLFGYYVYVYSDPETRRPFYVGKGKGNRVFNHMDDQSENEKVRKINDIKARGAKH